MGPSVLAGLVALSRNRQVAVAHDSPPGLEFDLPVAPVAGGRRNAERFIACSLARRTMMYS